MLGGCEVLSVDSDSDSLPDDGDSRAGAAADSDGFGAHLLAYNPPVVEAVPAVGLIVACAVDSVAFVVGSAAPVGAHWSFVSHALDLGIGSCP